MRILYIVYWGALEQLGRSLVVPSVVELARLGAEITLVTFEKPDDLANKDDVSRVRSLFDEAGIEWIPLKYHQTPKIPATIFDVCQGFAAGIRKRLSGRFDIVHARTFQAGLIGMLLAPVLRAGFVFHNEGFYPDEQVDAGHWGRHSKPHRYAKKLEDKMYRRADAVFVLSERSHAVIYELNDIVEVVPSCVDLERFESVLQESNDPVKLVYLGSIGGRYDLENISKFAATARAAEKSVEFRIISRASRSEIEQEVARSGLKEKDWSLESVRSEDVPGRLDECSAGVHFLKKGIAEFAGSPTKIGEYWAMGLPVVITPLMGDTDLIVEKERVGVVVKGHTVEHHRRAFEDLIELMKDKDLRSRCRKSAEEHYGLKRACKTQFETYERIFKSD